MFYYHYGMGHTEFCVSRCSFCSYSCQGKNLNYHQIFMIVSISLIFIFVFKYMRNLVKTINGIFSVKLFWSLDPEKKSGHFHTFRSCRNAMIS